MEKCKAISDGFDGRSTLSLRFEALYKAYYELSYLSAIELFLQFVLRVMNIIAVVKSLRADISWLLFRTFHEILTTESLFSYKMRKIRFLKFLLFLWMIFWVWIESWDHFASHLLIYQILTFDWIDLILKYFIFI